MRLDLYILREWAKIFLLSLGAILGLLLLDDIQDDLQDLIGYGAKADEILVYYLIKAPSFIPMVLPIGFLISLLFHLTTLNRNLEIISMRAAGMSVLRITRSLWVCGAVLTFLLFQLNANVVPWSVEQSRLLWDNHRFEKELAEMEAEQVGLVYNLTFYNHDEHRLWFLNRFNEYNYRAYGVTVSNLSPEGHEQTRIVANEGYYDDISKSWVLQDGREITFRNEGKDVIRSLEFEEKAFTAFGDDPELMKFFEKRPKHLSFDELGTILNNMDPETDQRVVPYVVAYYDRLFNPLSCLIVLGLAIPFSLQGIRTTPFVGVAKAMSGFMVYYVVVYVGQFLGRSGLDPVLAAALPNVIGAVAVIYFFQKFRRPS